MNCATVEMFRSLKINLEHTGTLDGPLKDGEMEDHAKESPAIGANYREAQKSSITNHFSLDCPKSKVQNPLALALAYAEAGLPVFPCRANGSKAPHTKNGFHSATTDAQQLRDWWSEWPDALVGLPTGAVSGVSVIDLDLNKETGERIGEANFAKSEVSREGAISNPTTSGGEHLYYRYNSEVASHLNGSHTNHFAPKVDVRNDGGYVIAAGNVGYGSAEALLQGLKSLPVYPAEHIGELCEAKRQRERGDKGRQTGVEVPRTLTGASASADEVREILSYIPTPEDRSEWINVLMGIHANDPRHIDLADEWSQRGTKYRAGEVEDEWRSFKVEGGIGFGRVCKLAEQHGADLSAISRKYAKTAQSKAEQPKQDAGDEAETEVSYNFKPWEETDFAAIERTEFIYSDHFAAGYLNVSFAAPKTGKSLLALAEAIDVATGRGFLTGKPTKPMKALYYNAEDDLDYIKMRVAAVLDKWKIPQSEITGRLFVVSGMDEQHEIVLIRGDSGEIDEKSFVALEKLIARENIKLAVFDPLQDLSRSPETNEVFRALGTRIRQLAVKTQAAVGLVHHTRKPSAGVAPTIDDGRGGGALRGVARFNRLLVPMTEAEGLKAGVDDFRRYFKIGEMESNLAPPSADRSRWFEKESVIVPNGQSVGTISPWSWPEAFAGVTTDDAKRVRAAVLLRDKNPPRHDSQATDWVGHLIADVLGLDMNEPVDKARIKEMQKTWTKNKVLRVEEMEWKDKNQNTKKSKFVFAGENTVGEDE